MTPPVLEPGSLLYEQDYYLWIATTIDQLRQGRLAEVDLDSLIEELEDMGKSQKSVVKSNLRVVLMHLLKYAYQPANRSNSWLYTLLEHRTRLADGFKDSPSLRGFCGDIFDECYSTARKFAATETGLPLDTFPSESPFTPEQTLNPDYLPESTEG